MAYSLSRRDVLALASASAAALILPGCGRSLPTVNTAAGKATLTFAQFGAIAQVGGAAAVQTDTGVALAVVRISMTDAIALDLTCTHAGCTVDLDTGAKNFPCPCHSSVFDYQGNPTRGPAQTPLRRYVASVGSDGVTVTVA